MGAGYQWAEYYFRLPLPLGECSQMSQAVDATPVIAFVSLHKYGMCDV